MKPTIASRTDVGRVRTNNEDSFLVDEELGLYIIADGMGGHNAGEVASKMACEIIQREMIGYQKQRDKFAASGKNSDIKSLKRCVDKAISTATKEIYKHAAKNKEQAGMGTTCTVMFLAGHGKGILGHVGDSRLFVYRNKVVHQLSEDHTFVNEMLKRGAITKAQAKNHPQGNVLSRALGPQPSIPVDTMIFDVDEGDTYLICSDGLYNYFPNSSELSGGLAQQDIEAGMNLVIDLALERGGHDNTTAIVLRFGDPGEISADQAAMAAEHRIAMLKKIPIFSHLTYNELVKVVGLTTLRHAEDAEDIVVEGSKGDEFFVVLSGSVDIYKAGEKIVTLPTGSNLGEMSMIDNAPRSATVRAVGVVNLLVMRREEFFGLIRSEPVIATKLLWSFVGVLSGRLRETNEALQGAREELADGDEFAIFLDDEEEFEE